MNRRRLVGVISVVGVSAAAAMMTQQFGWWESPDRAAPQARPTPTAGPTLRRDPVPQWDFRAAPTVAGEVPVSITVSGQPKDRRTMRIVSARADLTGQRELAWAINGGTPVGEALCTQTFRIRDEPARERPTMLMCWRTSKAKSVYVIAVNFDQRPSADDTVAVVGRVWSELG